MSKKLCITEVESARKSFKDVTHITAEKLQEMQSSGPVTLVDVRSPEERAISIIPGAVSLSEMPNPLPADAPLVLYCTVGVRSALEARRLASIAPAAGICSMGGILEWCHAGGKIVDPASKEPTLRVHTFGARWAPMAPEGYEALVKFPFCPWLGAILRVARVWVAGQWVSITKR